MEVLKENQLQLSVCCSKPSQFQDLLLSQKKIVHCQIDQLQNIVLKQCSLTGVNPLSQEMAAGALSIKIGKRPRDLLNPKAVKYMQSVFSIKDAITKKESREISAFFGVTVTQVRDFFTSQRSRVRKFVRLSKDKSLRSNTVMEVHNGDPMKTDPSMSIYPVSLMVQDVIPVYAEHTIPTHPVPLKVQDGVSMDIESTMPTLTVPLKMQDGVPMTTNPSMPIYPVLLKSAGPVSVEGPSCSIEEETLPGLDGPNRHFVENIFAWMWKEETFSGQVKLMEQILQIQNSSVLYWFLTKGGVTILVTWLSQAASEEQTSVVDVVFKVLSHLPLHKALPAHMSAILQSVNSLRFYRKSDISNRARFLLSRWSKIFARSQAMKKPNAGKSSSDAQTETMLRKSICEIMGAESWESKIDVPEDTLASSFEGSENFRKLLPTPVDDSSKKLIRGVSSSQSRERRKVLLVEQPGQKSAGRSTPVARSVTASQGRPLSADDIQKAKMRAQFMQSKYGKSGASSIDGHQVKTEGSIKISSSPARTFLSVSKAYVRPQVEGHKVLPPQGSVQQLTPMGNKKNLDIYDPLWKKCKRVQIRWQTPAEMTIPYAWTVGIGENSKEIEVQRNRIRREKETIYRTSQEIPLVPKEPWDHEMEYDDSLTPEIPTEQLPDCDGVETVVSPCETTENNNAVTVLPESIQNINENMAEPDLELLAVLLKNPELVFALTSGQSVGSLSSEETVKLLDMIKAKGGVAATAAAAAAASQSSSLGGSRNNIAEEENVPVCLPSPTPSSDPVTSGRRPLEVSKNPFCGQSATANRETIPVSIHSQENLPPPPRMTQCSPQTDNFLSENRLQPPDFSRLHQSAATSSHVENIIPLSNSPPPPNLGPMRTETSSGYVKPATMSVRPSLPFLSTPLPPHRTPGEPGSSHWRANEKNYYNTYPYRRTEFVGSKSEYESWSPPSSPTRSPAEYIMPGWYYPEKRTNTTGMRGCNHKSELDHHHHRSRPPPPRHSSSVDEDNFDRQGKRSWRDDWRK